jgi:hypothetical protein
VSVLALHDLFRCPGTRVTVRMASGLDTRWCECGVCDSFRCGSVNARCGQQLRPRRWRRKMWVASGLSIRHEEGVFLNERIEKAKSSHIHGNWDCPGWATACGGGATRPGGHKVLPYQRHRQVRRGRWRASPLDLTAFRGEASGWLGVGTA